MRSTIILLFLIVSLYAECRLIQVQKSGLTGDLSGKVVFTKARYYYECNETTTKNGECIKWDIQNQEDNTTTEVNISLTTIDEEFSGSMGEILKLIGVSNELDHLFSGWSGYCIQGISMDFSWLKDPYMWANFAMTYFMTPANTSAASSATSSATSTASSTASSTTNVVTTAGIEMSKQAFIWAKCSAMAGIDTAKNLQEYFKNDPIGCNPVDEICDEESSQTEETTFTLTRNQYEELLKQYEDITDYVKVVKEEGDVLLVEIVSPSVDTMDKTIDQAKEEADKIKKKMLIIKSVLTTASLAGCVLSNGGSYSSSSTDSSLTSIDNIANMTIGAIPSPPMDPLTKIGLQLATKFFTSFTTIDSCDKEKDAKEQGSRHEATYSATRAGMCHFIYSECINSNSVLAGIGTANLNTLTSGCALEAKHYCCYDSVLARILVEQVKAQLARDWTNCSDFSLKELSSINIRQCTQEEMNSAPDGTKLPYNATIEERMNTFQYKYKCLDLREYADMLKQQTGEDVETKDIWDSLRNIQSESK